MIRLQIIALGKLKEDYLRKAESEYSKRLSKYCNLQITELAPAYLPENPSEGEILSALKKEADMIISRIPTNAYTAALCIESDQLSSEKFAGVIDKNCAQGRPMCFIIGSSYGLSDEVKRRADFRISVSKMTFPHQLFRVMLLEQIYRGFKINEGSKYHK